MSGKINDLMEDENPEKIIMVDGKKKTVREVVHDLLKKKREFMEG